MEVGDILRLFVIVSGVFMVVRAILSLAKRKMTEPFCLEWVFLSALMILSGALLNPSQMKRYVSTRGLILTIIIVSGVLWGLWFISTQVSILKRKNRELAMQVSLLNNDYEKIIKELEKLEKENKNMKEIQLRQQLASITVMDHGIEYRLTPEYVQQHMYAAVINTEKNAEMLERCPHEEISNLSVVAKCELGEGKNLLVTDEFVQLLHMSGEEIIEHAKANSAREGYVCQNLSQIISQVFAGDLSMQKEVSEMINISEDDYPMYVVTTSRQYDGASVIVSKPFLEDVHKKLGEDYYVLPSSRHEVLAVPVSRAPELPDLKDLVHMVNQTEVQERD